MSRKTFVLRVGALIIGFTVFVSLICIFISRPILADRHTIKSKIEKASKQVAKQEELTKQKTQLNNQLSQINNQLNQTISPQLSTAAMQQALEKISAVNGVQLSKFEVAGFYQSGSTWNTGLRIGLAGACSGVLKTLEAIENMGANYYVRGFSFLQEGAAKNKEAVNWTQVPGYLSCRTVDAPKFTDYNYVDGQIQVPVLIKGTDNQAQPALRLLVIKYSDNTIRRYEWKLGEALISIGGESYSLGYPTVDFDKRELQISADIPLESSMINKEVDTISLNWKSFNRTHTVSLAPAEPLTITEAMLDSANTDTQTAVVRYNKEMLNAIIQTEFNIVFVSANAPDAYISYIANKAEQLKQYVTKASKIRVPDKNNLVLLVGQEEVKYAIKDDALYLNSDPVFKLDTSADNRFQLQENVLTISLGTAGKTGFMFEFEHQIGVSQNAKN